MRGVRRKSAEDNISFEIKCQEFKRLVRVEAVADEKPRLAICAVSCMSVKYVLHPVQANLCVSISSFGTSKMPYRRWMSSPRASIGGSRPY